MEKQHIDYPVSSNYRKEWGDWEAVREIVQNALDSESIVEMISEDYTLCVRDYGDGFELKHLLIGESTKDGENTIGKFGEGLKFGLLTLLRQERGVSIRSNNIKLDPELVDMFGAKCLRINYNIVEDSSFIGTEVVIKGIFDSFRDRFLSLDHKKNFEEQILLDRPGDLFIKGIYVKNTNTIAGYNLIIERENPLSGEVNDSRVENALCKTIEGTPNQDYMRALLTAVKDHPAGNYKEFSAGYWRSWAMRYPDLWAKAVEEVLGKKACRSTNPAAAAEARYRGYNPITCTAYFLKGIIPTDWQVIIDDNDQRKIFEYSLDKLPEEEYQNLRRAVWLIGDANYEKIFNAVKVVDFLDHPETVGSTRYNDHIKISVSILNNFNAVLDTLMHEAVHFYYNADDLTGQFQDLLAQVARRIIIHLAKGRSSTPPDDFQLEGRTICEE